MEVLSNKIFIPEQFTVKDNPALFEGEGEEGGGAKKVRNNTLFPVYIHIQNQTLKSNISKTVRDR